MFLGACQRSKHRDGARRFVRKPHSRHPKTPQVFYWAYISEFAQFLIAYGKMFHKINDSSGSVKISILPLKIATVCSQWDEI